MSDGIITLREGRLTDACGVEKTWKGDDAEIGPDDVHSVDLRDDDSARRNPRIYLSGAIARATLTRSASLSMIKMTDAVVPIVWYQMFALVTKNFAGPPGYLERRIHISWPNTASVDM